MIFSQTGNTLKVGVAISQGLASGGVEVEQVNFLHRHRWKPDNADIIGIGSPVFENRPAEIVTKYLDDGGFDFTGKKAFVFITSGGSPAKSLWHLAQAVNRTGAAVVCGLQCRGRSSFPTLFGLFPERPEINELATAEQFGRATANNLKRGEILAANHLINRHRGGFIYDKLGPLVNYIKKKSTPLPISDQSKCTLCGNCVYECPTKSITLKDKTIVFSKTCIVCYRCWHVCPNNAITINFSPGNGLMERILYGERMERLFGNVQPGEEMGTNLYKDALARSLKLRYDRKQPTADYDYIETKSDHPPLTPPPPAPPAND